MTFQDERNRCNRKNSVRVCIWFQDLRQFVPFVTMPSAPTPWPLNRRKFLDFCTIFFPEWSLTFFVSTIHQVIWPSLCTLYAAQVDSQKPKLEEGGEVRIFGFCTTKKTKNKKKKEKSEAPLIAFECASLCRSYKGSMLKPQLLSVQPQRHRYILSAAML